MTGTACEFFEYEENEAASFNNFDLFSLWLFETLNNDQFQVEDSGMCGNYDDIYIDDDQYSSS